MSSISIESSTQSTQSESSYEPSFINDGPIQFASSSSPLEIPHSSSSYLYTSSSFYPSSPSLLTTSDFVSNTSDYFTPIPSPRSNLATPPNSPRPPTEQGKLKFEKEEVPRPPLPFFSNLQEALEWEHNKFMQEMHDGKYDQARK